jgi:hypothetical protein
MKKIILYCFSLLPLALSAMSVEQAQEEINRIMEKDTTTIDLSADSPALKESSLLEEELITRAAKTNNIAIDKIKDYSTKFVCEKLHITSIKDKSMSKDQQELIYAINNVSTKIAQDLKNCDQKNIDKKKLDFILAAAVSSFTESKSVYQPSEKTIDTIDNLIKQLFADAKISIRLLPKEMNIEFLQKRKGIIASITDLMVARKTTSISQQELTTIVHDAFKGFIDRVKHLLISNWVYTTGEHIKQKESGKPLNSSIKPSAQAQKLKNSLSFLQKQ